MKYIEALYEEFNRKYFRNQLPKILISYSSRHFDEWGYFAFEDGVAYLSFSPILKNYHLAMEGVLLHEMVHAFLWHKYYVKGGLDVSQSFMWFEHTREFRNIEKMNNKRHFGNPRGHKKYFNLMVASLDKNRKS